MKLIPTTSWSQYDVVTVKLIVTNKFDAQPNPPANGTSGYYPFGMSVGGRIIPPHLLLVIITRCTEEESSLELCLLAHGPILENVDNPHADFAITRGAVRYALLRVAASFSGNQVSIVPVHRRLRFPGITF